VEGARLRRWRLRLVLLLLLLLLLGLLLLEALLERRAAVTRLARGVFRRWALRVRTFET
jgi:hypothetical protein